MPTLAAAIKRLPEESWFRVLEHPTVPKILKFDNTVYVIDIICIHIKPLAHFYLE